MIEWIIYRSRTWGMKRFDDFLNVIEIAEIGETMENYGTFKRKVASSYHK